MTGTNDKLRSLFLTVLMVVSVFGATVAFSGTAAAANDAVSVTSATEANGDITVEFNESIDAWDGTSPIANADNVTVWVRGAADDSFTKWNGSSDGPEIPDSAIDHDGDGNFTIEGANTWGDLYPADEAKVNISGITREGTSGDVSTGNVSVDLSSAVLEEGTSSFNTEGDARRLYQGSPITLDADSPNTPFLFQNVDNNQTLAEYSTGEGSTNFVFDTGELNVGETYRIVFNPTNSPNQNIANKGPRSTKYIQLDSLDLTGSLAEDGTTFDFDESQDISVDGSAKRANQPALVQVGGQLLSANWSNAGQLIDSDYSDLGLGAGDYTVTLTDIQTGNTVEAGSFSVREYPEADSASFAGTFSEVRGGVAEIDIELEDSEERARATVAIGSVADDTNYVTNVTVADNDGNGEITLEFNTYNAGTNNVSRVFSAVGEDTVVSARNETGAFVEDLTDEFGFAGQEVGEENLGFARRATLDAGSYGLQVAAHDSDQRNIFNFSEDTADSVGQPDDVSALSLGSRSTESSNVWVAPAGSSFGSVSDIQDAAGDTLTQSAIAAEDEVIVHEITATGLEGIIRNRTDVGANQTVAFLEEEGAPGPDGYENIWNASFQETEPTQNRQRYDIDLTYQNSDVYADFENDKVYVVLQLSDVDNRENILNDGTSWNASFTINDYEAVGPVLGGRGGGTVDSDWTYRDANAELATNDEDVIVVRNQEGQLFRSDGMSTLAPTTTLELYLDASGATSTDPFVDTIQTDVQSDRTFQFSYDFSDKEPGTNFTAQLSRPAADLTDGTQSYDVQIKGTPTASVTFNDQNVGEENQVVRVSSVTTSDGGFVAIHEGSAGGPVIGVSDYLEAGQRSNVRVLLEGNVSDGTTLVAMPHLDTDADENYNFDASADDSPDGPYTADGAPVTDSGTVSIVMDPANFQVSGLTPAQATVTQGDVISAIEATVENTGETEGTQTVELRVGGTTVDSQEVTLAPGESTTVTFENVGTDSLSPGTYQHGIFSADDDATGALGVDAEPTPTPTPTEEPTPTPTEEPTPTPTEEPTPTPTEEPTPTPTDEPTPTATEEPEPTPTDTETSSDGGPGFGIALAIVALLGAALLAVRRD